MRITLERDGALHQPVTRMGSECRQPYHWFRGRTALFHLAEVQGKQRVLPSKPFQLAGDPS